MTSTSDYIRYYGRMALRGIQHPRQGGLMRPVYFDPPGEAFVESFETLEDEDIGRRHQRIQAG